MANQAMNDRPANKTVAEMAKARRLHVSTPVPAETKKPSIMDKPSGNLTQGRYGMVSGGIVG
jgi:hypothetical protein